MEDSPDQDRSITDAELEYLQVGGLIFYYLQDYFEKYVSVNINQLRVIAKHHLDKTSENYGRHQYHHQCRHIIIFQNTVGVTAREATAKPPWRAMMTSKAVSKIFMKVIFMIMMTSKAVSRNFMKIIFMSMIVNMKNETATTVKVWAIITAHFTENWGFYTLLTRCSDYH